MDLDELQVEIDKLVNLLGPRAEELFSLAIAYEKTSMFLKLRDIIIVKDSMNDQIAVDTLAWAWEELSL